MMLSQVKCALTCTLVFMMTIFGSNASFARNAFIESDDPQLRGHLENMWSLIIIDQFQSAYDSLDEISKCNLNPEWDIKINTNRARLLSGYLRKDYELSNSLLEQLVVKYPEHPDLFLPLYQLERNYQFSLPSESRDLAKASEILVRLMNDYPVNFLMFTWQGDLAMNYSLKNDYETSLQLFYKQFDYLNPFIEENEIAHSYFSIMSLASGLKKWNEAAEAWWTLNEEYRGNSWTNVAMRLK